MSVFGLPSISTPPDPLPPEIEAEIATSTTEFEKRFGSFAVMARSQGWIEDYRRELRRIAAAAMKAAKA